MESSQATSTNKSFFSNDEEEYCSEESGWTIYFEDFFASQKTRKDIPDASYGDNNSIISGSSLVSDAASYVHDYWKKDTSMIEKKLISFKKRKTKRGAGIIDDDSLEDTASSPVNSPKICDMKNVNSNQRRKEEYRHNSQDRNVCFENKGKPKTGDLGFVDIGNSECTELKKRGLCLVPLSMLVDYLG